MTEIKILICDDDPDLQGLLVRRLDKMGVKPDVAGDGRVALALVDEHNYDVIVTDIYMPEATGLEVLQHAKHLDQDTQVIIITSSATLDNAIDALNHGAFGYLTKPFDHLIVFDNMVSRAIEYRHLLVAEKRKTEAQKRRGDMLEDEVADRVQQLQKKQKGLLDLLGSLPDGILVVEAGGKVVLSSPVGERWLARDEKSEGRPIHSFIAQVHAEMAEPSLQVRLGERELQLMAVDFPHDGEAKRRAVIIREVEESAVGAGSLVTDTVMGIKKGLATLYEQGLGTEIVLNLANQFAVLEQMAGWTGGTAKLRPPGSPVPKQPPAQPVESPSPAQPAESPPPAQPAESPPPTPAQPVESAQPAPEQPVESAPPTPARAVAEDPQPTTVSSSPPFMEPRERVATSDLEEPRLNTAELQDALRTVGDPSDAEAQAEPSTPAAGQASQMEDTQPAARSTGSAAEPKDAAAPEAPGTAAAEIEGPAPPVEQPPQAASTPEPQAPPAVEVTGPAAPRTASNGTGELEPPTLESEADFPVGRPTGELDSAVFRPRVIPEEMNAKLETPTELPNANGKRGLLARAKGPIKIQSPQADTQMFRRVLAGLSGSEVEGLSGDKDGPPKVKPKAKAKAEPEPPKPERKTVDLLEEELDNEFEPEAEKPPEPAPDPEPLAERVKAQGANWPPKRPSEDPEWDDGLDVSN